MLASATRRRKRVTVHGCSRTRCRPTIRSQRPTHRLYRPTSTSRPSNFCCPKMRCLLSHSHVDSIQRPDPSRAENAEDGFWSVGNSATTYGTSTGASLAPTAAKSIVKTSRCGSISVRLTKALSSSATNVTTRPADGGICKDTRTINTHQKTIRRKIED